VDVARGGVLFRLARRPRAGRRPGDGVGGPRPGRADDGLPFWKRARDLCERWRALSPSAQARSDLPQDLQREWLAFGEYCRTGAAPAMAGAKDRESKLTEIENILGQLTSPEWQVTARERRLRFCADLERTRSEIARRSLKIARSEALERIRRLCLFAGEDRFGTRIARIWEGAGRAILEAMERAGLSAPSLRSLSATSADLAASHRRPAAPAPRRIEAPALAPGLGSLPDAVVRGVSSFLAGRVKAEIQAEALLTRAAGSLSSWRLKRRRFTASITISSASARAWSASGATSGRRTRPGASAPRSSPRSAST
jgi:hypothetical protein